MNGRVKFFNYDKGFGFIIGEDNKDYFVHKSQVAEGSVLEQDTKVSFDSVKGDRGWKAENVTTL